MAKIDETELRRHDKAIADAVEFFHQIALDNEMKSYINGLEDAYVEVMDVVMEKYELPEDWK